MMPPKSNYRDIIIFLLFFCLSFICLICADIFGHNSMGAYISPIPFNEIDWAQNSMCSLVAALVSTFVLHKKK